MSTLVLPSLVGLGFDVVRTPVWDTTVQAATSGKETRIARQVSPRWKWELTYNVLRSNVTYAELQQLAGFFNTLRGQFDTFLYQDQDDNTVGNAPLGVGDGVTVSFQLVRPFGGFYEYMYAPQAITGVYINGAIQHSGWSYTGWGSSTPGVVTFATPPANAASLNVDFSYYFPCRMTDDSVDFSMFLSQYYRVKKFSFISVKN